MKRLSRLPLALCVLGAIGSAQQRLPAAEALPYSVSLRAAQTATYPGQDVVVSLIFRSSTDVPSTVDGSAFTRDAFAIVDSKGKPPKKSTVAGATGEPLALDGYGVGERRVNLSAWYPNLSARRGTWTITWKDSGLASEPLKLVVTEPYDKEKDRVAVLETEIGTMTWELLPESAPLHVKHFVDLARQGFYDGLTIFRVLPGVQAEGGDPKGDGTGGWESLQMPEISSSLKMEPGLVGSARPSGVPPSTMTSDSIFFIALATPTFMKGTNTFFAKVTDGWDVLAKLSRAPSRGDTGFSDAYNLIAPVNIHRVTIR